MTLQRCLDALSGFWRDARGNFAMMTAILAVPLIMAAGVSIDVARFLEYRTRLANAADAAALGAISDRSKGREEAFAMAGNGRIAVGEEDAESYFAINFIGDDSIELTSVEATVVKDNDGLHSRLDYQADVAVTFAGFFQLASFTIKGSAEAQIASDAKVDFYLLLDNSPSMGLGATMADIDRLVANTPDKCAFACHALNDGDNYYNLAKSLGVAMRIDVVRQAAQKLTETAKDVRTHSRQFRMAVHTFGEAATDLRLTEVAALSSNMNKVRKATGAVDLMTIPYQNYDNDQQTNFDRMLTEMNGVIPDPGSGLGGSAPRKVLFFVTDGVNDTYKPATCSKRTTKGRCQEPIDTRLCEAIKDRGIKIAVLYTTYLPLPSNSWYNSWIKPFQGEIGTKLETCASPGLYFEVSPSEGIAEAMNALFLKAISVLRLVS